MSITQLKTPRRDDADPLRAALAQGIAAAAEARDAVQQQRAAIEKTRIAVREAERAVKAAEAGIQTARENHAAALADAAASDAAPPASGMRAARQAVEDAQDEVEAVKEALVQLKQNLPSFESTAREADIAVDEKISALLAVQVQQLLNKAREIASQLSPLRNALVAFLKDHPSGADVLAFNRGRKPLADMEAEVRTFFHNLNAVDERHDPWGAAREILRADPNAILPEF